MRLRLVWHTRAAFRHENETKLKGATCMYKFKVRLERHVAEAQCSCDEAADIDPILEEHT